MSDYSEEMSQERIERTADIAWNEANVPAGATVRALVRHIRFKAEQEEHWRRECEKARRQVLELLMERDALSADEPAIFKAKCSHCQRLTPVAVPESAIDWIERRKR